MLNLTAHTYNDAAETVTLERSGISHVHVEFTPAFSEDDIKKLSLDGPFATIDAIELYFDRECTPVNPFYVRWINDDGGFNYQMFSERYVLERAASDLLTFEPFIEDTTAADAKVKTISVSGKDIVTVGVGSITLEEFNTLSKIAFSPKIERYNTDLQRWERINLSGNQSNKWQFGTTRGEITLKFEVNRLNVQF